jgi:hypothetical protein
LFAAAEAEAEYSPFVLASTFINRCIYHIFGEDRGLLRAGQVLDEVGHPAYLLPTPRQYLSSEHKSDSLTLNTF